MGTCSMVVMVTCNSCGYEYESKVFQTPDEETGNHFNFHHIIIGSIHDENKDRDDQEI
jgi:hypothetical protein